MNTVYENEKLMINGKKVSGATNENFMHIATRAIDLTKIVDVKQVIQPANKVFAVEVYFKNGEKQVFNYESEPAAREAKTDIIAAIRYVKAPKETGLTK